MAWTPPACAVVTTSPSRTEGAPPPVEPTGAPLLAVAAAIGALAGWGVSAFFRATDAAPAPVPWLAPAGLALLTVALGVLARDVRRRVQERRERVDPARAVVWLALGKAAALGGAALSGGYAAYGLSFVGQLAASAPRERLIASALSAVVGVALCAVGLRLERACRVPGDGDQEDAEDTPGKGFAP